MKVVRCKKNHYYDEDKYGKNCPHCDAGMEPIVEEKSDIQEIYTEKYGGDKKTIRKRKKLEKTVQKEKLKHQKELEKEKKKREKAKAKGKKGKIADDSLTSEEFISQKTASIQDGKTEMLQEDRTEILMEDKTEMLQEDRTEILMEDKTEMLYEDKTEILMDDKTEMLDQN